MVAACAAGPLYAADNLVGNGSFKAPMVGCRYAAPVTGSVITDRTIGAIVDHRGDYWTAQNGNQSVDHNGGLWTARLPKVSLHDDGYWVFSSYFLSSSEECIADLEVPFGTIVNDKKGEVTKDSVNVMAIPEPEISAMLLAVGFALMGFVAHRRRRSTAF